MKIKVGLPYLLALFTLVFLIHELHDWAHFFTARFLCGCWGARSFDSWAPCPGCGIGGNHGIGPATIAGPIVNYIFLWRGLALMSSEETAERQSLGFSFIIAALPFSRILGAMAGGGDETAFMRMFFQRPNGSNHLYVAAGGLLIVLLINLPPIIRAFLQMPEWWGKLIILPLFLVVPGIIDNWVVHVELNNMLAHGIFARGIMRNTPQGVIFWLALLLVLIIFTWHYLYTFFDYPEYDF